MHGGDRDVENSREETRANRMRVENKGELETVSWLYFQAFGTQHKLKSILSLAVD